MSGHEKKSLPYEQADVSIKGVVVFAVVLTIATALVFVLMAGTFKFFEARSAAEDAVDVPATLVPGDGPDHPPEPVLQGAPGSRFPLRDPLPEMDEMLAEEDEALGNPGWVDKNAGIVRLPIETAKQRMLERGFPVRPAPAGDAP